MKKLRLLLPVLTFCFLAFYSSNSQAAAKTLASEFLWEDMGNDSFLIRLKVYYKLSTDTIYTTPVLSRIKGCSTKKYTVDNISKKKIIHAIFSEGTESCSSSSVIDTNTAAVLIEYQYVLDLSSERKANCCEQEFEVNLEFVNNYSNLKSYAYTSYMMMNICKAKGNKSPEFVNHPIYKNYANTNFISHSEKKVDTFGIGYKSEKLKYSFDCQEADFNFRYTLYNYNKPFRYYGGYPKIYTEKNYENNGFILNDSTGQIRFLTTSTLPYRMVYCINIEEYKNGSLIGETQRIYSAFMDKLPSNQSIAYYSQDQKISSDFNLTWNVDPASRNKYYASIDNSLKQHKNVKIIWKGLPPEIKSSFPRDSTNLDIDRVLHISKSNSAKLFNKDTSYSAYMTIINDSCPYNYIREYKLTIQSIKKKKTSAALYQWRYDKSCNEYVFKFDATGPNANWYVNGQYVRNTSSFDITLNKGDTIELSAEYKNVKHSTTLTSNNSVNPAATNLPNEFYLNLGDTLIIKPTPTKSLPYYIKDWKINYYNYTFKALNMKSLIPFKYINDLLIHYKAQNRYYDCTSNFYIPLKTYPRLGRSVVNETIDTCLASPKNLDLNPIARTNRMLIINGTYYKNLDSVDLEFGQHKLQFLNPHAGYFDSTGIILNLAQEYTLDFDTTYTTCIQHNGFGLPQPLNKMTWTGKGVIIEKGKTPYFNYPKDTTLYVVGTRHTFVKSCFARDSIKFIISGTQKSLAQASTMDTTVCHYDNNVLVEFKNFKHLKPLVPQKKVLKSTDSAYYLLTKPFPGRLNDIIFNGYDRHHCQVIDTIKFNINKLNIITNGITPSIQCRGDSAPSLQASVKIDYWTGNNVIKKNGQYTFKYTKDSFYSATGHLTTREGCIYQVNHSLHLKDTMHFDYKLPDTLCQGNHLLNIKKFPQVGEDIKHKGIGVFDNRKSSLYIPDTLTGSFTLTYENANDQNRSKCYYIGPFKTYVKPFTPLKSIKDSVLCESSSAFPLISFPKPDLWKGNGVYKSGSNYMFDPKLSTTNVSKILAIKDPSSACSDTIIRFITIKDSLIQQYQLNRELCQGDVEIKIPDLKYIKGTWALDGIGSLSLQTDSSYLYTAEPDDTGKVKIYRVLDPTQKSSNCITNYDLSIRILPKPQINQLTYDSISCSHHLPSQLMASPSTMRWSGNGVSENSGAYFFDPKKANIGKNIIQATLSHGLNTCKDSALVSIQVHPHLKSPHQISDTLCQKEEIHYIPSDARIKGNWIVENGNGSVIFRNDSLYYNKPAIDQDSILLYHQLDTNQEASCIEEDRVRLYVYSNPSLITQDSIALCPHESYYALSAQPKETIWQGKGVKIENGNYYFDISQISEKHSTINAILENEYNCKSIKQVIIRRRDLPILKHNMADTLLCINSDDLDFQMRASEGTWRGVGIDSVSQLATIDTHDIGTAISFYYEIENSEGCISTDSITVRLAHAMNTSLTLSKDSGFAPLAVDMAAKSRYGQQVEWDFGDNFSQKDLWDTRHVYDHLGEYTLQLVVDDHSGNCTDTLYRHIVAYGGVGLAHPEGLLSIYPNPTSNSLTIEMSKADFSEGFIYNSTGQLIKKLNIYGRKKLIIDVAELSDGIYLLELQGNTHFISKQFIKH